ncbi:MAG: hypothetical protein ACOX7B_05870 [Christensenellales bacterium]|jgi:hypothetical protein
MLNFDYPKAMTAGRVCLEISLKPFKKLDDASIHDVCDELFCGWRELIRYADSIAVMLWTSDGSEILEYDGNIESTFEWARYIGIGNPQKELPDWDKAGRSLHSKPVLYMDNPPEMRYIDLKRIIIALKEAGQRIFGMVPSVIETFDPGPEFAYSRFKFDWHKEIAVGKIMGVKQWVHCASYLHADQRKYAAYPQGIPEGTPLGEFLGRQFMRLKEDVGFDGIWLSNGFGYSLDSWNWTGELFDGEKFDTTSAQMVRSHINEFWKTFTDAVGDTLIETRGSNLSTGMDIAAHGTPINDIYNYNIVAPPNSPWAALNYRFGLELAGYMSHIAHLPKAGFPFRFYTHDPWWYNSPWFDRYGSSPHDIYLPLAIARMDEHGQVTLPRGINFLSADDSHGNMPRRCPIEVTPHILNALSHYPDAPGLLTWVYPFDTYVKLAKTDNGLEQVFMGDWLIENAIDEGLPLNTVVSDANFANADLCIYKNSVLLMPVPDKNSVLEKSVLRALDEGMDVMLYGNVASASDEIKSLAGVVDAPSLDGEFMLKTMIYQDEHRDGKMPMLILHDSLLSQGGLGAKHIKGRTELLCEVCRDNETRAYATYNPSAHNGRLIWFRGSFPHARTSASLPTPLDRTKYFPISTLMRCALERFGICIRIVSESTNCALPIIFCAKRDNATFVTYYAKDTTVKAKLAFPDGAPLMIGTECIVENNMAEYALNKWQHVECRVYIKQEARSVVSTTRITAGSVITNDHRISIAGLRNANITFCPPQGSAVQMMLNQSEAALPDNVQFSVSSDGRKYTAKSLTGILYIGWQLPDVQ